MNATDAVLDSLGMFDATRRVPEATETAILAAQDAATADARDVRAVALAGEGPGRWAADVVAAICAPLAQMPVVVVDPMSPPAFVRGDSTLVLRFDPVAAGSAPVSPSLHLGAQVVPLGVTVPHARVALGALPAAALVLLQRVGVVDGIDAELDHAVAQLHRRRAELFPADAGTRPSDHARTLARRIDRLFPLVYGEGDVGRLAARRWKQQCNVNAKIPAFAGALADIEHDEIAGFGQHGDVTRQVLCSIVLRHDHEADGSDARFARLDEVLTESTAAVHEVRAAGTGRLAQLLDLAFVGDVVSLHLAAQVGLDPGPAPALSEP